MDHTYGAYTNGVQHWLAPTAGLVRDVQTANGGNTVVGLGKDNNLHVTMMVDAKSGVTKLIEGPFECFAVRANVPEIAAIRTGTGVIERYAMHCAEKPYRLEFAHPTAVAYNNDGTMMVTGNAFGTVMLWNLNEDGPPRPIVKSQLGDEGVVRLHFEMHNLTAITGRGRCYRIPLSFYNLPSSLITVAARARLLAGDGKELDWHCYAYAGHPTVSLDFYGGECGILAAFNESFDTCAVKQTGLGAYIRKLVFCAATRRLVVMGQKGVQIWTVEQSVLTEEWEVAGDLAKLAKGVTGIKALENMYAPPRPGFQPYAYAVIEGRPTIFWA